MMSFEVSTAPPLSDPPPPEPVHALSARADTATAAMTAAPRAVVIRDILISCDRCAAADFGVADRNREAILWSRVTRAGPVWPFGFTRCVR